MGTSPESPIFRTTSRRSRAQIHRLAKDLEEFDTRDEPYDFRHRPNSEPPSGHTSGGSVWDRPGMQEFKRFTQQVLTENPGAVFDWDFWNRVGNEPPTSTGFRTIRRNVSGLTAPSFRTIRRHSP